MPHTTLPRKLTLARYESGYALRGESSATIRITVLRLVRRELDARTGPVLGRGMVYWRQSRMRAVRMFELRNRASGNSAPLPPLLRHRHLPPRRETLRQIRRWNMEQGRIRARIQTG